MVDTLTIRKPDDWHIHFRDGDMLKAVVNDSASQFGRGIIMPNLVPPVVTGADAKAYRERIMAAIDPAHAFTPLMTLYLTDNTDPADVRQAAEQGIIHAVKLYPAGATTNSASGVTSIAKVMPVLETMAEINLPLCVHGEVTSPDIDIFDREAVFLETQLQPLQQALPSLKVTLEHVTTADGVNYVRDAGYNTAATITPHHLMINRNHMLVGGIRPHYYCLPIVKRATHQQALRDAATSGHERFFLGTDSAPHLTHAKESSCGCAGVYNTPNTMACLAQVFDEEQALDQLEAFCSINGPRWYGMSPNDETTTLTRQSEPASFPDSIQTPEGTVTVFDPGVDLYWSAGQ